MNFIFQPGEPETGVHLGGKARALASLQSAGLPIPPWFVLLPESFEASLGPDEQTTFLAAQTPEELRAILAPICPGDAVREALGHALAQLCPQGERVAVRSSAIDEDSPGFSFAGQLDSFLFVPPAEVAEKVAAVWRSGFSERILAYRREHGLSLTPRAPAVLIQRMVNPEVSGVAFGADPVAGRRGVAVVSAVYGLGTALVSGESDADTWRVDREGDIFHREIAHKGMAQRFASSAECGVRSAESPVGGPELDPVPQESERIKSQAVPESAATQPALTDDQIRAVAALARRTGRHFARPQDIEWAIEDGRLYLLQSRPITTLTHLADPDGRLNLWDNSNIIESYSGVTTPLTFSFARYAYECVYRQFCRLMAVPKATLAAHDEVFRQMLGLVRGRVYYNLLSWYRVLAMLPGFTINRRFMEQMMGVKEGLPEELAAPFSQAHWTDQIRDALHLAVTAGGLLLNHFLLPHRIRQFYQRLSAALAQPRPPLEELRPDELAGYYHGLERQLLTRWDAPLINDFFAMIFYGVLRKLATEWCGDQDGTLQNNLLCGEGGMISAEPARRVRELARLAGGHPEFVGLLCDGSPAAILEAMPRLPEFQKLYAAYLEQFGDRCLEELKLESATLHDDPLLLLRAVGHLARSGKAGPATDPPSAAGPTLRAQAEQQVTEALRGHRLRRLLFHWVLRHARARVRDRENLRFERTRVFGRVRRVFVELGRRLHALDLLEEPRDIFYLEVNEVLGFVEGTATTTNLKGLAAMRKAEFAAWREAPPPAERFETRGLVHHGNPFEKSQPTVRAIGGHQRKGIGCCPGVVRGRARVVTDPRHAELRAGEILVAERTDPGWIMLFPSAAGLLVERGSLLSHSAIVAREMGIPAIVSIDGVTIWLKDGDMVELDGSTGIVRKMEMPA